MKRKEGRKEKEVNEKRRGKRKGVSVMESGRKRKYGDRDRRMKA